MTHHFTSNGMRLDFCGRANCDRAISGRGVVDAHTGLCERCHTARAAQPEPVRMPAQPRTLADQLRSAERSARLSREAGWTLAAERHEQRVAELRARLAVADLCRFCGVELASVDFAACGCLACPTHRADTCNGDAHSAAFRRNRKRVREIATYQPQVGIPADDRERLLAAITVADGSVTIEAEAFRLAGELAARGHGAEVIDIFRAMHAGGLK